MEKKTRFNPPPKKKDQKIILLHQDSNSRSLDLKPSANPLD